MKWIRQFLPALALLIFVALPLAQELRAEILAQVGDEKIDDVEFKAKLATAEQKLNRKMSETEAKSLLDSLVNQRLLVLHARDEGIAKRDAVKRILDEQERQVLEATVYQEELAPQGQVSEADLKAFYTAHPELFESRQVSQIVISPRANEGLSAAKERADALFKQVQANPKAFAKLAKEKSDDLNSAKAGGDLGYVKRNMAVKPLSDAIFSAKPDTIIGPVQTQFGFHLLYVKASRTIPYEDAKAELAKEISGARIQDAQAKLLDDLKKKYKVSYSKDK